MDDQCLHETVPIRELIRDSFNAEDFERLCHDYPPLRPVLHRFGPRFSFDDMIDAALIYCEKWELLPDLLAAIQQENPRQYARHRDRLRGIRQPGSSRFFVPFIRNPDFVGREQDLERLHQALQGEGKIDIQPVGLTGMGGVGKTQLAVEYAYRYRGAYPGGIFWIDATQPLTFSLAEIGRRLFPMTISLSLDEQLKAAAEYLLAHVDALLILDNLADPAELNRPLPNGVLPAALACCQVFTTRRRDLGHFRGIEVTTLSKELAVQLLLRHPSRRDALDPAHPEHTEACAISALLGYLPLALEIAGAHLGRRPEAPLVTYRRELLARGALPVLDDQRAALYTDELPTRHAASLAATLFGQWEGLGTDARMVLQVAGQLPEAAVISIARLGLLAGLDDQDDGFFGSTLDAALCELADASLLEELRAGQVRLHPLVRQFAAGQIPSEDTAGFRLACAARLAHAYDEFVCLEDQCAKLGVDALQEDLLVALTLLQQVHKATSQDPNVTSVQSRLQSLLRLFQREHHLLRGWDRSASPGHFAQRVLYRASNLGISSLAANARARLGKLGQPYLDLRWRAGRESPALHRTLGGHLGGVTALAVTPDGRQVISAAKDFQPRVWDLETGQVSHTLDWQKSYVLAIAVTPDGEHAVSGSEDGAVKFWDLRTGQQIYSLVGHKEAVRAIVVTPDGQCAISASDDHTLKVWDLNRGAMMHSLEGHSAYVHAVAVTPGGEWAVSASADSTLKVWDLHTGSVVYTLEGHMDGVRAVAVTPEGRRAVSRSRDGTLRSWDLHTGRELHTWAAYRSDTSALAVTPNGCHVVSLSDDQTLKVWNLNTGQETHTLKGHTDRVYVIAVMPDSRHAISASQDRTCRIWDLNTGQQVHALVGHVDSVFAVAVTPDGRCAISASQDGTVRVWDITLAIKGELEAGRVTRMPAGHESSVEKIVVTPDGQRVVSTSQYGPANVLDLQTGQVLHTLKYWGWGQSVAVTPDSRRVITNGGYYFPPDSQPNETRRGYHYLVLWNLETGQAVRTLVGHLDTIYAVAVTSDGQRAVSASMDCSLKVWDLATGYAIHTLTGHTGPVYAVALTPDDQRAVSASHDGTLRVWDLATGREERTLIGHGDFVFAAVVTPNGQCAVSASEDSTCKVWDLQTGKIVHSLARHGGSVLDVVVTPDGRCAISRPGGYALKVWNMETGREISAFGRHNASVTAMAVIVGRGLAVSVSRDRTIRVWSLETGGELASLALESEVMSVAAAPDGCTLVAGDQGGNVYCLEYVAAKSNAFEQENVA